MTVLPSASVEPAAAGGVPEAVPPVLAALVTARDDMSHVAAAEAATHVFPFVVKSVQPLQSAWHVLAWAEAVAGQNFLLTAVQVVSTVSVQVLPSVVNLVQPLQSVWQVLAWVEAPVGQNFLLAALHEVSSAGAGHSVPVEKVVVLLPAPTVPA